MITWKEACDKVGPKPELEKGSTKFIKWAAEANQVWLCALFSDYPQFTTKQLQLIFSLAYEERYSAGFDEVAKRFVKYVDYFNRFVEAGRE